MQISRHWRMNSQRYRLVGARYQNGEVSLQVRPTLPSTQAEAIAKEAERDTVRIAVPVAIPVGK